MRVVHLIGGGDVGGAKGHVLSLVKALGRHIDVKLVSLRPGPFADDARAMGIDVEVVKSGNIVSDIKQVKQIIREGKYEIIHSHGAKANMFSLAVRKSLKLPSVTTIHSDYRLDYMHSRVKSLTIGNINSIALRSMDYYIAISGKFREMLIERHFRPSEIFILYNGMDFSLPATRSTRKDFIDKYRLNVQDGDILIGILARLNPVKSIDTLIKAAKIVNTENRRIKFIIGGDGEQKDDLVKLAKELELEDTVLFAGWVNDQEEFNNAIDMSVLTSISESFPYSILEGVKYKKATVSSRVGGIPDLIEHGYNGYMFEPRDYKDLARLILELASDENKRRVMGERIFEKAVSQFSLENMCRTQLGIYTGILEKEAARKRSSKDCDVIISGYYGFNNIGDDAMLMSIVHDLKSFKPDIRMMILSKNPVQTSKDYNTDSIGRTGFFSIFRALKNSRTFLYGGGNLIQDDTSTRSLIFYLVTIWLAKNMGLKVMFYANGIGPLRKKLNRWLTGRMLNCVDVITLREELSYSELKSLGITRPEIHITADPALANNNIPITGRQEIFSRFGLDPETACMGFSVRSYPGHDIYKQEVYESAIAGLANYMLEKFSLMPVFIPMQHPVDIPVLKRIAGSMKNRSVVIEQPLNVQETASLISHMELLAGMRLHALIFAAAANVPVIGLSYQPKIDAFLEYSHQASAGDVLKLEYKKLRNLTEDVWLRRAEIKKRLQSDMQPLRERALENGKIAAELISRQ